MKKLIIISVFIMILGNLNSQVSLFISPDFYTKMSFNSEDASLFGRWGTKSPQIPSGLFTFESVNYSLIKPFRLGISIGIEIKNRHEFILGLHSDGVSSKSGVRFLFFQPITNTITPGSFFVTSISSQTRAFLAFRYYIKKEPYKNSFSLIPSIGIAYRAGGGSYTPGGSFGISGTLTKNGINYEASSTDYTYGNNIFLWGLGISSDIYSKNKYLFSLTLQYSHTKRSLYQEKIRMKIIDTNIDDTKEYVYTINNRASGLYLTISKKIKFSTKRKKIKTHNRVDGYSSS